MNTSARTAEQRNPLRLLPSVLGIRDLQRRWRLVVRQMQVGEAELALLLRLDPLAVLRGLRAANAPVFRQGNDIQGVESLVRTLGLPSSQRLLDGGTREVAGTGTIRSLWRQAVATGLAAESLARQTEVLPPPTAYLLGLLHALPAWLAAIHDWHPAADPATPDAGLWLRHWQLPASLTAMLSAAFAEPLSREPVPVLDAMSLLRQAKRLARIAGYHHDATGAAGIAGYGDQTELLEARRLQRQFEGTMRTFGLDLSIPDSELDDPVDHPFPGQRQGNLDEVVLQVLGLTGSESYRGIVTALTAAAVRYGSYDRVIYAKWVAGTGQLRLRSKADATARRLTQTAVTPNGREAELLRAALQQEQPSHVTALPGQMQGLLGLLSTDELLAVPLNRSWQTPAFLLFDRSLTLAPLDVARDGSIPMTLGLTGTLLHENLLLRRRRDRAQKFAATDPLTRLSNRRIGLVALEREIARAQRSARPLTLLMCDLDHFKLLNDTFGHLQGDQALRTTADVLRQTLRRGDVVCRYGGEEFLVVLAETDAADATVLAARLFTAVEARGQQVGLPITISVGLTSYRPGDTTETMLQRADSALYASKGHGRNRFSADVEGWDDVPTPRP